MKNVDRENTVKFLAAEFYKASWIIECGPPSAYHFAVEAFNRFQEGVQILTGTKNTAEILQEINGHCGITVNEKEMERTGGFIVRKTAQDIKSQNTGQPALDSL